MYFCTCTFNCVFVSFACGIPGQVWYLIVSILDFCRLTYLNSEDYFVFANSADPDEMPINAIFQLGLLCLQKYP